MRVAIYARVSTADKEQDPDTQLMALRDWCKSQGWGIHQEYIDTASANDQRGRTAWRELMDDAAKRQFNMVIVFKLDRAFRSVKDMHDTLSAWEIARVDFTSLKEGFDTSTPMGDIVKSGV